MRLEESARFAKEHGFSALSTTLTVSPYQYVEAIGEELERYRVDHLVTVGDSEPVAELARAAQARGITTQRVGDAEAAAAVVGKQLRPGDVVLVKASNSQGLWHVAAALQGPPEAPGGGAAKTIDGKN